MKFKSDIEVQAGLKDSSGANGTSGQVLSSNGTTVSWINAGSSTASDVQNQVKAGVAINKGQAVYVTGADGTNIIVGLASNTSEATSSKTLGLLNATVAINGFADVVQIGKLAGLDTSTATVGDPVWLGTNGNLIYGLANKPYAPAHLVYIGVVTRVNANNGEIFVTVQNGFELKEIHDVDIITAPPVNGDVLGYNGTLWVNKTIPGWLGYTPVTDARTITINGTTQDLSANRSWSVGTVTSVAALTLGTSGTDLSSTVATGTTTPVITLNVPTASAANRGALSSTDWSTFNTKVGSVTASSPLASSGGSTPNITIQQASGSQNGYLSSTDWTTFNSKQASGNYITSLTGEATASGPGAAAVTLNNASVTGKLLTGVNITGGTVQATDTMLTAFGKLQNQINGLIGSSIYQGTWNASTNTPALASGVGTRGYYYIVNVAGTTNLDGITDWFVGDWVIFDGTAWQQVDNTDAVVSVNGQTGAVSLTTDNISEGSTNLYYLNSRARSALSFTAGSGAYNSTTGVITIPTNTNQLTNGSNYITLASLSGTAPITYNNTTGAISITQAGTASNGYLSSTDWNTFNNKTSNTGTVTSVSGTGGYGGLTLSGTVTTSGSLTLGGTPTGTWPISVSGSAGSVAWSNVTSKPTLFQVDGFSSNLNSSVGDDSVFWTPATTNAPSSYGSLLNVTGGQSWYNQLGFTTGDSMVFRQSINNTTSWTAWKTILNSSNYTSYSPSLTGSGASGTWGINITGNASSVNTTYVTTNADFYIPFVDSNNGSPTAEFLYTVGTLRYNPNTGVLNAGGDMRAPIFYDSNDTGYYGDFASTSNFNKLLLNSQNSFNTTTPGLTSYGLTLMGGTADYANGVTWTWGNTNAQAGVYVQSSGAYGTKMYFATTDSFATGSKTGMSMDHNGTVLVTRSYLQSDSSLRAPIFYDSNNTGYYVDPASSSYLNVLNCANVVNGAFLGVSNTSNSSGNGISLYNGGGAGQPTYGLMFAGTATFGTHGSITSDWSTYFTMNDDSARGWIFRRGSTNVASISGGGFANFNGDVTAYYSSDRRLKDNITPIGNALDKVKKIGGYTFDWNDKQQAHTGHDVGIIAQEIEAVLPEVVTTRDTGFKAVKYEKIVPLLIEAIKEQQTQIEELKELVNKLIKK